MDGEEAEAVPELQEVSEAGPDEVPYNPR